MLYKNLSSGIWPSCFKSDGKTPIPAQCFTKGVKKTIQMDFRSLYPSAQIKKQPVLNGILFSVANKEDAYLLSQRKKIRRKSILSINQVCQRTRNSSSDEQFLVPINNYKTPQHRFEEYYASRLFVQKEIVPMINKGYKLTTIAGASYAGKYDK